MLKKLLMLFLAIGLSLSAVLAAAVEVNTADETALESVKGIGPVHARAIIDERTKNGPFKDADDLATRVKGLGAKSVANLEAAGLTIGGSAAPPKGVKASKPAATTSTTPAATTGAATTAAPAPAASAPATAAKPASAKHASKKDKAASAAAASAPAVAASAPAGASSANAAKSAKKKGKKDKAASAAAASGA